MKNKNFTKFCFFNSNSGSESVDHNLYYFLRFVNESKIQNLCTSLKQEPDNYFYVKKELKLS
jgi:hypothetical protein